MHVRDRFKGLKQGALADFRSFENCQVINDLDEKRQAVYKMHYGGR